MNENVKESDMTAPAMQRWHEFVKTMDPVKLDNLLADDVVFYSPVVHTPQQGKTITALYLAGAAATLGSEHFRYVREVYDQGFALLEFETKIGDIVVNGVDMISWNDDDLITEFKVMIRPLKAVNAVHQAMADALKRFKQ